MEKLSNLDNVKFLVDKIMEKRNQREELLERDLFRMTVGGDELDRVMTEREQFLAMRLKKRSEQFQRKLEGTLKKIESGSYGVCEDCGCDIGQERLLARPTAQLCIGCQEEKEHLERGLFHKRRDLHLKKLKETAQADIIRFRPAINA